MPLPSLRGPMKNLMTTLEAVGLMQADPAPVRALFSENELASPDLFLEALQARFPPRPAGGGAARAAA